MIQDVKSSLVLSILGIDPSAEIIDMRDRSYCTATAEDLKVRSTGETFPVLLHTTKDRNRPTCESLVSIIDLGDISCAIVSGDKYGKNGAALFFSKSHEDKSLIQKLIA